MKTLLHRLVIILLALCGLAHTAQAKVAKAEGSYTEMWNRAAKAFNDDLPKSALNIVREISSKALADDNQPQLLRAMATECTISHEISPDSDAVTLRRAEEIMKREQRPAEKALWQYVVGKLRSDRDLLFASIADTELLAATSARNYLPAFVLGRDSRIFDDDLISVLTFSVLESRRYDYACRPACKDAFERMVKLYEARGNKPAALIARFRDNQDFNFNYYSDSAMLAEVKTLLPEIRRIDKRSKGKAARVLEEWVAKVEAPTVDLYWNPEDNVYYPGETAKFALSVRNAPDCELRIYSLKDVTSDTFSEKADRKALVKDKRRATLIASEKKTIDCKNTYEFFRDTLEVVLPSSGIYIAELCVDGKPRATEWLKVSDCLPVFFTASSADGYVGRMTLVDARTGQPLTRQVSAKARPNRRHAVDTVNSVPWKELTLLPDGSFDVSMLNYNDEIAIFVGENRLYPCFSAVGDHSRGFYTADVIENYARLYTDRAIYRPGQKVQVGGLVYSRINDDYDAVQALQGKLVLQDKDRNDIDEISVTTDDFGQFNAEFDLPKQVVPGRFSIVFRSSAVRTTEYIQVEEYKRPTFRVKVEVPDARDVLGKSNWEVGDTIRAKGLVETFSGIPVADAEVKWTTEFRSWAWLRNYDRGDQETTTGEAVTDDDGRFSIELVCKAGGYYTTSVDATAPNGETASSCYAVYVGTWSEPLNTDEEERIELFDVKSNKDNSECSLTLDVRGLKEKVSMPLHVFCNVVSAAGGVIESSRLEVTDRQEFKLTWKPEYGDGAVVYVGFLKNGNLYSSSARVMKPLPDKKLKMEWSTFRNHLQPGEQETWTLSVKNPDGTPADARVMARLYDASLDAFTQRPWELSLGFERRLPSVSLRHDRFFNVTPRYEAMVTRSATFDFTQWVPSMFSYYANMERTRTRAVRMAGGADSSELMYFAESMPLASPMVERMEVMAKNAYDEGVVAEDAMEMDDAEAAQAAPVRENFDETAFFMPALRTDADGNVTLNFNLPESLTSWNFTALAHTRDMSYGLLNDTVFAQKILSAEIAAPRFLREGDRTEVPVTVRNLGDDRLSCELIFLVSDARTGAALKTEKRKFALEPKGRDAKSAQTFAFSLVATTDVNVRAIARGKALAAKDMPASVASTALADVARQSSATTTFSDGEERFIPVLSGRETIQVSVPFSATKAGSVSIDLKPLGLARLMKKDAQCKPALTLEYCENPIWNVVRVVPALFEGEACCATDWATRLYAIEVGDFLSKRLQNTESAALVDSLIGATDIPALRYSALDHLKDFQRGDGGFCWFSCFQSSPWITTDVCILLARQQKMTGSTTARQMLKRAVDYLEKEMKDYVKEHKKEKSASISELALRYLYVRELLGLASDDTERYLLDLAAKEKKNLTMYGKSTLAQILQNSHKADALLALQSVVEHTVSTPTMGRYFDTERAFSGWASYKIPTQTLAIEALTSFEKAGVEAIATGECASSILGDASPRITSAPTTAPISALKDEMKLWLLQSKRTQKWESSRASADATYALLHGDCDPKADSRFFQTLSPEGYGQRQLSAAETQRAIASDSYNIIKEHEGLSWGALYADYTLPIEMVEQSSAGFTVSRVWEVKRDGKWVPISTSPSASGPAPSASRPAPSASEPAPSASEPAPSAFEPAPSVVPRDASRGERPSAAVKIGEHVRQVITVQAERDYDYVLVDASRAACLEPVHPLSGHDWLGGTFCYRMVRDSSNQYYFEHLAKGTHTFTEELVVDRTGTFATGLARVQCTYAPEFSGYAPSARIFVISK